MFDSETTSGEVLKERGQQLALDHSGDWKTKALEKLKLYIECRKALKMNPRFSMDEFRYWCMQEGELDEPKSINAFGKFPKIACKAGLIKPTGDFVRSMLPSRRRGIIKVWEAI